MLPQKSSLELNACASVHPGGHEGAHKGCLSLCQSLRNAPTGVTGVPMRVPTKVYMKGIGRSSCGVFSSALLLGQILHCTASCVC